MKHVWCAIKTLYVTFAVRWLSEHHQHDIRAIEEASIRFDLSPLDEEFLIQHCVEREGGAN
ncbi:hypothetical protein FGF01_05175 [Aeromonas salmonicida subsp. achromogenes]|nr:hypothetical protein FGF01_05175 [Aeromonas salmonicida subsp. achromogenes]TMX15868.1 hypothetical protein FGE99_05170 [Aeromonas salmonicida subsp. achromogenes]TMX20607.1 hypothetical protein FGF00_05045 [Aeromonas salmonicida subsp. achromogenes]